MTKEEQEFEDAYQKFLQALDKQIAKKVEQNKIKLKAMRSLYETIHKIL